MEKIPLKYQLLVLAFIVFAIIAPLIFTQPAIAEYFNFSDKGEIGDTIGGITAPIVGILSALLVYYSFRVQYLANEKQKEALKAEKDNRNREQNFQLLSKGLEKIQDVLNNIELVAVIPGRENGIGNTTQATSVVYKGLSAVNEAIIEYQTKKDQAASGRSFHVFSFDYIPRIVKLNGVYLSLKYIVESLINLINQIKENNYITTEDKKFLTLEASVFYSSFLKDFFKTLDELKIKDHQVFSERVSHLEGLFYSN